MAILPSYCDCGEPLYRGMKYYTMPGENCLYCEKCIDEYLSNYMHFSQLSRCEIEEPDLKRNIRVDLDFDLDRDRRLGI